MDAYSLIPVGNAFATIDTDAADAVCSCTLKDNSIVNFTISKTRWYLQSFKNRSVMYAVAFVWGDDWKLRKKVYMHRLILKSNATGTIDHINGDGLDNRRINLRVATIAQNTMNQRHRVKKSSRFRGVTVCGKTGDFIASIMFQRKSIYLGKFASENNAAMAYNAKANELFGEFARLNVLDEVTA